MAEKKVVTGKNNLVGMENDMRLDNSANQIYQQLMDMWITPSIKQRQNEGDLPHPLEINAAQIIFFPNESEPLIHINDEIKIIAQVDMKQQAIKKGELVGQTEIKNFKDLKLNENLYPNCGHATFIIHDGEMLLVFDFTKNKLMSKQHLDISKQFMDCAKYSLKMEYWSSFVDTLFSAKELIAKSLLLSTADQKFVKKTNHKAIHSRYNQFAKLGNVEQASSETFNILSSLRNKARYQGDDFSITEIKAQELIKNVEESYTNATEKAADIF